MFKCCLYIVCLPDSIDTFILQLLHNNKTYHTNDAASASKLPNLFLYLERSHSLASKNDIIIALIALISIALYCHLWSTLIKAINAMLVSFCKQKCKKYAGSSLSNAAVAYNDFGSGLFSV